MTRDSGRDNVEEPRKKWFKSSFSGPNDCCIEVTFNMDAVQVRDSKYQRDPSNDVEREPILSFTNAEWTAFIAGVKAGEFDRADTGTR